MSKAPSLDHRTEETLPQRNSKALFARKNPKRSALYALRRLGLAFADYRDWKSRRFAPPSPYYVKQVVLARNGIRGATWVETGTYLGGTAKRLAKIASKVYTIEPEPKLYAAAKKLLESKPNVEPIHGLSEDVFPTLLPKLSGDVCFWLDGHYSAGITHKGPQDCPVVEELAAISGNLAGMSKVVVMIDDIRCFDPRKPAFSGYPSVDVPVDWARANHFTWSIEHDIFVAKNF
jgi:hypothetical protein